MCGAWRALKCTFFTRGVEVAVVKRNVKDGGDCGGGSPVAVRWPAIEGKVMEEFDAGEAFGEEVGLLL